MNKILVLFLITLVGVSCNSPSEKKHSAKEKNENQYILAQNTTASTMQNDLVESVLRGHEIYGNFCVRCHRSNGKGIGKSFPPLAGSDYLMNNRTKSIRAVKYGQKGEIIVNNKKYNNIMESPGLEDDEVADVMNYIMNSWGNTQDKMITPREVAAVEK